METKCKLSDRRFHGFMCFMSFGTEMIRVILNISIQFIIYKLE